MNAKLLFAIGASAALAACAATVPPPAALPGTGCAVEPARAFVGGQASQDIGARMLAASGARTLRWVGFGQMVTMEFMATRLTVQLGPTNRITSVSCS